MGKHKVGAVFLAGVLAMGTVMTGCSGKDETEGKTVIEMVQYKPEAVDIFEASEPESIDVILMDIMMPVMDGLTATQTIRKLERKDAATVPILAMTANAFADDAKRSRQAGMNEHLSKPLDIGKVIEAIEKYRR